MITWELVRPVVVVFVILNVLTFGVTAIDKGLSKLYAYRVPERFLVLQSLAGGGIGTLLACYTLRHKTRHWSLLLNIWTMTILGLALWGGGVWLVARIQAVGLESLLG